MEIKTGQYIKLGRVWFKIKETSGSAKDMSNVNFMKSSSSDSSSENTNALISGEDINNNDDTTLNLNRGE